MKTWVGSLFTKLKPKIGNAQSLFFEWKQNFLKRDQNATTWKREPVLAKRSGSTLLRGVEKERTRREGRQILRWRHSSCTHNDACRRETAWVFSETRWSASRKTERLFQAQSVSHRTDWTSLESIFFFFFFVSSRSVHHGVFPDVYFYTQSLQRPHERRPMASRREQVSALFFVAWTQRRLTECFPWATEGPNPPKETLPFKKEFFWRTTSGSLPAGLNSISDVETGLELD